MGRLEIEMNRRNLPVPLYRSGSSDPTPASQLSFGAVGIDTDNLPKQQNQDGRPPEDRPKNREQMVQVSDSSHAGCIRMPKGERKTKLLLIA
jgi:hypothetical protein